MKLGHFKFRIFSIIQRKTTNFLAHLLHEAPKLQAKKSYGSVYSHITLNTDLICKLLSPLDSRFLLFPSLERIHTIFSIFSHLHF